MTDEAAIRRCAAAFARRDYRECVRQCVSLMASGTGLTSKLQIREGREHALKCLRLNFETDHVREILQFLRKLEQEHGPSSVSPEVNQLMRRAHTALGDAPPDQAMSTLETATRTAPPTA